MALKLIVDQPAMEYELSYLVEEKNKNEPSTLYIQGPYLVAETVNKNNRKYSRQEMIDEVTRFNKEMVQCSRSIGELNHPQSMFHPATAAAGAVMPECGLVARQS